MTQKFLRTAISPVALAFALAGCGGGSSPGTVAAAPTTPTAPTPAPPASPAPPTYSTYAGLTGAQSLATAFAGIRLGTTPGINGTPSAIAPAAFGSSVALGYDATASTYTPSGNGVVETFGAAEIDAALSTAVFTSYVKRATSGSVTSLLTVSQHFSSATNVSMAYSRGFEWYNINDPAGARYLFLIGGVPTLPTDVPATGTGEFGLTTVRGRAYAAAAFNSPAITIFNLSASQANCAIDFATGTVRVQMVLVGTGPAGTASAGFGNFAGVGTRVAGSNRFSGTFTGLGNSLTGSFQGAVFGPQAAECAVTFSFTGTYNGSPVVIAGTQAGARGANSQLLP